MLRMTRLVALFLSVCLVVGLSGCGRSPEARKARFMAKAQKYLAKKQTREARLELLNAVRIDPHSGDAQFQLAKVCLELKDYPRAFTALTAAVKAQPDRFDASLELAKFLLAGHQ